MAPRRKIDGRMLLLVINLALQAGGLLSLIRGVHPVYVVAAFMIVTEAAWSFGLVTPWLNCYSLALIERLHLGRGRLVIKDHVHWELRADDRAIGWVPTRRGWRRHIRRIDRLD